MSETVASIQKIAKNLLAFVVMLGANVVAAIALTLVIGSRIKFECVTPQASAWSLAVFGLLALHLAWRYLLNEQIMDLAVIGNKLTPLRHEITALFSEQEVQTLCFDFNVDYESLPAVGKAGKVRELIAYMGRRGSIPLLIAECCRQRPNGNWDNIVKLSAPPSTTDQGGSLELSPTIKKGRVYATLHDMLHPRPEILPDFWLWALTTVSLGVAVVIPLSQPPLFPPIEPMPHIESFSVQYPKQTVPLEQGDVIKLIAGEQVEVRAALRGSASTLCTWSAEKGGLQPAEGCSIFYSAVSGQVTDVLTVRVQSLCKTRETYGGLSVTVQTQ